jgi:hypothetical protein
MANSRLLLRCGAAAALCVTAACGSGSTPTGTTSHTESRWDLSVTVRYVRASPTETCDGKDLFGNNNPGEYQFLIDAYAIGDPGTVYSMETANYGEVFGEEHTLDVNKTYNFPNKTWSFPNLKAGSQVELEMSVTEWDGLNEDSYMNNRQEGVEIVPSSLLPNGGTRTDQKLDVGSTVCGLTLYYDVTVAQRQIKVSG